MYCRAGGGGGEGGVVNPPDFSRIPDVATQELIRDGLRFRMGSHYWPWRRVWYGVFKWMALCFIAGMAFQAVLDWNETSLYIQMDRSADNEAARVGKLRKDSADAERRIKRDTMKVLRRHPDTNRGKR